MKVTVKSWKSVAQWKWRGLPADTACSICQQPFESCCQNCIVPGENCPPTKAPHCNHWFHLHCAQKWVESKLTDDQKVCPNCRSPWLTPVVKVTASTLQSYNQQNARNNNNSDDQEDEDQENNSSAENNVMSDNVG